MIFPTYLDLQSLSCFNIFFVSIVHTRKNVINIFHFWMTQPERKEIPADVETELNGDSKSTNEKGPSLFGSLGLSCRYKRFCSALAALIGPVQKKNFPSPYTISFLSPSPSKPGGHAASPVSKYVSLDPNHLQPF